MADTSGESKATSDVSDLYKDKPNMMSSNINGEGRQIKYILVTLYFFLKYSRNSTILAKLLYKKWKAK